MVLVVLELRVSAKPVRLLLCRQGVYLTCMYSLAVLQDIQWFCCYSHLVWATLVEILIVSSLLYVVLGRAAFGGLAVMGFSMCLGLTASKV
jgi:hypothetical protein